jgi:histone deacetylase 6
MPGAFLSQLEAAEDTRDSALEKVRLKNINLRRAFRKLEKALRAKDQLADGLHMIDFEQLKVENQTLNEKIEERSEELNNLKRKNASTVQVLTHFKEKLKFMEHRNARKREDLSVIEANLAEQRDSLAKVSRAMWLSDMTSR